MSLTPGWEEKSYRGICPGENINFTITADAEEYFFDNGSEFKRFPRTKTGWYDLCDTLKDFEK